MRFMAGTSAWDANYTSHINKRKEYTMSEFDYAGFKKVCTTLLELGVPAHVYGYSYLVRAIMLARSDPSYLHNVTKRLYPEIARECETTSVRVERSIRNAIEIAFTRCDIDRMYDYFGSALNVSKGKVTNSEFIATVVQKLIIDDVGDPSSGERSR